MSSEASSVFIKPKVKRANIRKRTSSDDDDTHDDSEVSKVIEETRTFQKFRMR